MWDMIKVCAVELKPGTNEELLPNFDESYPHITSNSVFDEGYRSPWHWHKAVELFYLEKGTLEFITPSQRYVFHAGTGGMINSNVLHKAVGHSEEGNNFIHLFDPVLISGSAGSAIDQKYVLPLTTASQIEMIIFDREQHRDLLQSLRGSFDIPADVPGYELQIRSILSDIWLRLLEAVPLENALVKTEISTSELAKQMMIYMHEHYGEKLAVRDIAQAASVSERTCFELFRRNLRTSPMEYLNSYRLRMACQMLTQTTRSVTEISGACGMNNSYFSQVFREATGFTPLEYRRFYRRHQHSMEAQEQSQKKKDSE